MTYDIWQHGLSKVRPEPIAPGKSLASERARLAACRAILAEDRKVRAIAAGQSARAINAETVGLERYQWAIGETVPEPTGRYTSRGLEIARLVCPNPGKTPSGKLAPAPIPAERSGRSPYDRPADPAVAAFLARAHKVSLPRKGRRPALVQYAKLSQILAA